jgi:glycosyltransferase involved in cell wall biosynthesis
VIDQEGSGIGAARHQGAECARGEWYAFVDADTELTPAYLDAMYGFVREEGLIAASSRCELTGSRRAIVPQFIHNHLFPRSDRPVLPGFNTFVHREAYEAAGGYRNLPNEDKALSRRLAAVGKTGYHPERLVRPSGRRVAEQGLFGMTWHYLDLDLQAIAREDAGDRFRPIALTALALTLLVGLAQGYHGLGLDHLTAVLGAIGGGSFSTELSSS